MAKHARENEWRSDYQGDWRAVDDARSAVRPAEEEQPNTSREQLIRDHASQASALLANRAAARSAGPGGGAARKQAVARQRRESAVPSGGQRPSVHRDSTASASRQSTSSRGKGRTEAERGSRFQADSDNKRPSTRRTSSAAQANRRTLGGFIRENIGYIASVVVVVLVVTGGLLALRAFLPAVSGSGSSEGEPAAYVSPYNWAHLDRSDGRFAYVVDGQVKSRLGVDVSSNQGEIDWNAVARDGIDFAIIRLGYRGSTEGGLYIDDRFKANIDGARAAGIDCGVYFFSQALSVEEAVEEADFAIESLQGRPLEYPIAFDSEVVPLNVASSRTTGLGKSEVTAITQAFCDRVRAAGYRPMLYGNAGDLARVERSARANLPIWWAEYNVPQPSANTDIAMWQYSNEARVNGIDTVVDIDIDLTGCVN